MSLFIDFEVGSSGRRFRRAVDQDKKDIEQIMKRNESGKMFPDVDIGRLIEICALSICMIDEKKQVTGFLALDDRPDEPAVDPAAWEEWIGIMFQRLFNSRGTLFIHCVCCDDSVLDYFLEDALISVFLNDAYLRQIILVIPPGRNRESLTRVHSAFKQRPLFKYYVKGDDMLSSHCLQVAYRQDFCPRLKIRRAVEEDNDDIIEILDTICPRLKELYGKYYVSEIVGQRPANSRQIIVAQLQDRVVGVMCLNSEINYNMLQKTYELNAYHGLIKPTPMEIKHYHRHNNFMKTFGKPLLSGKWSPFDRVDKLEVKPTDDDVFTQSKDDEVFKRERASKVNFRPTEIRIDDNEPLHDSEDYSERHMIVEYGSQADLTVISTLEDEPLDYEIVNIDGNLLTRFENSSSLSLSRPNFRSTVRRWTKTRRSSLKTKVQEPMPHFEGTPNAFIIEIFGLIEGIDERLGYDMLRAAFECMQAHDYCIIRVPTFSKSFALLQHFCVVPPKPNICTEHAMYVTHRNSILGKFKVRRAEYADVPQIAVLLQALDVRETIWTIKRTLEQEDIQQCYVFLSGTSIIGIAILEPPEQIDFLRKKFTIDHHECHQYHSRGHGVTCGYSTIKTSLIYPIFEMHFRFFMREVMRLANSSSVVWLTPYRNKWIANKANALAVSMLPLLPRKSSMGHFDLPDSKISSNINRNTMSFCTWYMNKKLSSVPKLNVDCRIVVIGASRVALGFLNTLLFQESSTYLTFTSVTLVSPHGLPYLRHSNPSAELMFPKYRTYTDKFLKCTPYTYYVNIVQGIMVEIDKKEKYIALDNRNRYYYDLLFLCLGTQYQHPDYMKTLLERDELYSKGHIPYIPMDMPKSMEMDPPVDYDTPENVFIINSIVEAATALNFVKSLMWEDTYQHYQVLVYGATIEAYCCITSLLDFGVSPKNIVFIEAFPPEDPKKPRVPVFCNTHVDKTVRNAMKSLKLKVYTSTYFVSWGYQYDENLITHVEFLSNNEIITLECNAFFYYGKKGLNPHAFIAMNKAGIGYDGGILIDHEFRTKDPYIYAAGPCTRYYRRYLAEYKRHKYYDSHEVGKKLGTQIRNQLDPHTSSIDQSRKNNQSTGSFGFDHKSSAKSIFSASVDIRRSSQESMQEDWAIPILKKPIKYSCILPGNLRYLDIRPPGVKVPHYYIQSLRYNGNVMETFQNGYFKIHTTNDMIVDGITCLTREKYSLDNFKNFYGLSSVVLSNVYLRYTSNKIDDFFTFFRSPWATFLYQDQLDELLATVKELIPKADGESNTSHDGQTLEEALRNIADTIGTCPYEKGKGKRDYVHCIGYTKELMKSTFEKSAHFGAIADYIIEWLAENESFLPMYVQPAHILEFRSDSERHEFLKKNKLNIAKSLLNESQNSLFIL